MLLFDHSAPATQAGGVGTGATVLTGTGTPRIFQRPIEGARF